MYKYVLKICDCQEIFGDLADNVIFYAATFFSGILAEGREYIKGKTGFGKGFTRVRKFYNYLKYP
jgi:hypothetical protein